MNEKTVQLEFAGHSVEILRRPYQRSLNLKVRLNGVLRITCGRNVKIEFIKDFLLKSHSFIERSLEDISKLKAKFPRLEFVSGERLLFRGEHWPLEVVWSWNKRPQVKFLEHAIELKIHVECTREERQRAIAKAYTKLARITLADRVIYWSDKMKMYPRDVSVRGQRTRWGSCSPDGRVNLNWKLLGAPAEVIDYVVIHELAHLTEGNHSSRFWKIVEAHCPNYRELRRWLKTHQYELEFLEAKSQLHQNA